MVLIVFVVCVACLLVKDAPVLAVPILITRPTYLLHIPRRDVLTGLFAVPWSAGEAALLASTSRKYMQNI